MVNQVSQKRDVFTPLTISGNFQTAMRVIADVAMSWRLRDAAAANFWLAAHSSPNLVAESFSPASRALLSNNDCFILFRPACFNAGSFLTRYHRGAVLTVEQSSSSRSVND
tara:strand:- start:68154 stop:68486 length:333 start_codon:yes stop_codon:yes gene_type:complete